MYQHDDTKKTNQWNSANIDNQQCNGWMAGSDTRKEPTNMDDHCLDNMEGAQPTYLLGKSKRATCNALRNQPIYESVVNDIYNTYVVLRSFKLGF
jgi:hypothetical protein